MLCRVVFFLSQEMDDLSPVQPVLPSDSHGDEDDVAMKATKGHECP